MPAKHYDPIRLTQSNRYPGYQFHARVRMDGMENAGVFRYLILTVCDWVLKRIPEEDRNAPELRFPPAEEYAYVDASAFLPYHFSVGYALDITPLMDSGIWAMRLKEPDQGTAEREPVPGRSFTTRIGIRTSEKGYTELGILIDVTDPASVGEELSHAFRPGFVRDLFEKDFIHVEQVQELAYRKAIMVDTEDEYRKLLYMLDSEDNQLPLVVFTYYQPGDKKPAAGMSMEDFIRHEQSGASLLPGGFGMAFPAKEERQATPVLPYDADAFCGKAFAYAVTYVLGDPFLDRFRSKVRKEFGAGDILLCGARKFRGGVTVFGYPGGDEREKKTFDSAVLAARSYSKHKAPYSYGTVVFEAEARKMEQHARIMELVASGTVEEKDKVARLTYEMELLFGVIDDKDDDIRRLNAQKSEAFERGVACRDSEYARLEEENNGLKRELAEKQDQIDGMLGSFRQAKNALDALGQIRNVDELPQTNEDVVRYFKTVYRDRLGFTDRGETEAARCGLKPENLWKVLYTVANDMVEVFRNVQQNLTEETVMKATGFDVSFREGSMTREQKDFMRLRQDVYEGREISVEPHVKLKPGKGVPEHQRLHFCYIPELRRIVIGYLGDHLESAATQYVK